MWREKLKLKKSNVIAGLYPFTKMWIMVLFWVIVIISGTARIHGYPVFMIAVVLLPIIFSAAAGVFGKFMNVFSKICILAFIIIAAQSLLIPGPVTLWQYPVFSWLTIRISEHGVQKGLVLASSVLNIGGSFIWLFGCTENKELVYACEKRGMSPKAGYVLLSTLQMISVLHQSSKVIMSAQEARGVETKGNLKVRMKAFMPSLIPLILGAINNTEERVLTLESKGFTVNCPKTRLFHVEPNGKEKTAIIIAITAVVLTALWRISLWVL